VSVFNGFPGKHKTENYREFVDELVDAHQRMACSMSLNVHVARAHLDKFIDNMGSYSEEQGERFHQNARSLDECQVFERTLQRTVQ